MLVVINTSTTTSSRRFSGDLHVTIAQWHHVRTSRQLSCSADLDGSTMPPCAGNLSCMAGESWLTGLHECLQRSCSVCLCF